MSAERETIPPSDWNEAEAVEAVARAINEARYDTDMWHDRPRPTFEEEARSTRAYAYRLARAAIRALARPDPEPAELAATDAQSSGSATREDAEAAGSGPDPITKAMVNAAWNAGKDRGMTGLPSDFRAVLEAALSANTDCAADMDEVAKMLWHRFAPKHHSEWEDEPHKSEYRGAAEAIISAIEPAAPEGRQDDKPRAYIVHAPEDDYYGTGPDSLQFHPLAQRDLDNGYRQTPLFVRVQP